MENIEILENLRTKDGDSPAIVMETLINLAKALKADYSQTAKNYPSLSASEKKKEKKFFMKQEESFKKIALCINELTLAFKGIDKGYKEAARALAKAKKVIEEN